MLTNVQDSNLTNSPTVTFAGISQHTNISYLTVTMIHFASSTAAQ